MLKNSFIKSGFKDVNIERLTVTFDFVSADAYANYVYETAGPLQAILANVTQERKEEILKAVTEAARKYADNSTGSIKISNEAVYIMERK